MKTYRYDGHISYVVDDSEDDRSFWVAKQYFEDNFKIITKKYVPPFFDEALMEFSIDNIHLKIFYDSMIGTEISIDDTLSETEISEVAKWSECIYETIQSGGNTKHKGIVDIFKIPIIK